jgi:hypothetical protein
VGPHWQPHITTARQASNQGRIDRPFAPNRAPGGDGQAAHLNDLEQDGGNLIIGNLPTQATSGSGDDGSQ